MIWVVTYKAEGQKLVSKGHTVLLSDHAVTIVSEGGYHLDIPAENIIKISKE